MPHSRGSLLCAVAACAVAIGACGSSNRPAARIQLHVAAPVDGTRVNTGSVTISGTVAPVGSGVLVLGRSVAVTHGSFTTRVPLQPGSNIVDVLAGARNAQPAMTAVRVYRLVEVTIPSLSGAAPSDATRQLEALGLVAQIKNTDQFYDFFLPTSPSVCSTSPGPGRRVAPGTTVTVSVSKTC